MLRAAARARRLPPRLTPSRRGNRPAAASPARKGYAAAPEARPSPPLCAGHFRPRAHRPSASDVEGDGFGCGTEAPRSPPGGPLRVRHRGTAPRWRRGARGRASPRGRGRPGPRARSLWRRAAPRPQRGAFRPGALRSVLGCGSRWAAGAGGQRGSFAPSPGGSPAVCINSVICSPAESCWPVLIGDKWGREKRGKGG